MGWSVSEHSQPERKRFLWEKRLRRLRGALKSGEGPKHIAKAAEAVRLAALALIKAKLALISEYPRRDPKGNLSAKLRAEEQRWRLLPTEEIIQLGRAPD